MRRNYCRSVISLQEPLPHSLWISLDTLGILAIVWSPAYPVVSICVCWPPKRRVYNITSSSLLHRKYILLLCCLLKVSPYHLAPIDTASVHIVKGISQHIHNRRLTRKRGGIWPSFLLVCARGVNLPHERYCCDFCKLRTIGVIWSSAHNLPCYTE